MPRWRAFNCGPASSVATAIPSDRERRKNFPFLVLTRIDAVDSWSFQQRGWVLGAHFVEADGSWRSFVVNVDLTQNRRLLLKSPEHQMLRYNPTRLALEAEFDKAVSQFTRTDAVAR